MAPEGKFWGGNRWTIFHIFSAKLNLSICTSQWHYGRLFLFVNCSVALLIDWKRETSWKNYFDTWRCGPSPTGRTWCLESRQIIRFSTVVGHLADEIFPVDWNKFVRPRGNCVYVNGRKETWWQVIWPTCDWWPITGRIIKNRFAPSNDSDIEASTLAQQAGRRGRKFQNDLFHPWHPKQFRNLNFCRNRTVE